MGLRDDKKRATRTAIADAALARFRSIGFERTRVRDIARELRISEATFFNYFPTKHAVLEAAADQLVGRAVGRLEAAQSGRATVAERLHDLNAAFAAEIRDDRDLAALLARHTRAFGRVESAPLSTHRELVTALFAQGQQRGEIRGDIAPDRLSELYEAAMLVAIHGWLGAPTGDPLIERLAGSLDVLLHGSLRPAGGA